MSDRDHPREMWETTQWSVISKASGRRELSDREAAWVALIERYRVPIEKSIRRHVQGMPDADRRVDEFFGYLFESGVLQKADRTKGRFRAYVQGVIRRYALHQRSTRSGGAVELDLEQEDGPTEQELEEREESEWAEAVLASAVAQMMAGGGRDGRVLLETYGIGGGTPGDRDEICDRHGLNRNALNQALHRARGELKTLIMLEISETVSREKERAAETELVLKRLLAARPGLF